MVVAGIKVLSYRSLSTLVCNGNATTIKGIDARNLMTLNNLFEVGDLISIHRVHRLKNFTSKASQDSLVSRN